MDDVAARSAFQGEDAMLFRITFTFGLLAALSSAAFAQPSPSRISEVSTACVVPSALRALNNPKEVRRSDPGWIRSVVADGQCSRLAADQLATTWGVVDGITDVEVPRGSGRRIWVLSSAVTADRGQTASSAGVIGGEPAQNWTAFERGSGFSGVCGLTGSVGEGSVSLFASADRPGLISLALRHPAWRLPAAGRVAVGFAFSDRVSMIFSGRTSGDTIEIALTDNLRKWTHEFTAASSTAITFPGIGGSGWSLDLAGTTSAITAMVKCVEANASIIVPPPFAPTTLQPLPPTVDYQPSSVAQATPGGADKLSSANPEPMRVAAPAPPNETFLAKWSGDTMMTTRPFRAAGAWELRWTASSGYFSIRLLEVGSEQDKLIANQTTAGSSTSYRPSGGTFYLEITGTGPWSVQAVGVPGDLGKSKASQAPFPLATRSEALTPPPAQPMPLTNTVDPLDAERELVSIVNRYANIYRSAQNDMLKGASRPARGKEVCALIPRLKVTDWTGEIHNLSSNNDGKGVITIRIGDNVYLQTWNNAVSDMGDHTLIDPESGLFQTVSQLAKGRKIRFSGEFVRSGVDCFKEASLTVGGAMTEPEYIFRFSDIQPLN